MASRKFDVIVLGATGYTGRLVVEYLSDSQTGQYLQWAIAGRDASKLDVIQKNSPRCLAVVTVDLSNPTSLDELCVQTKVVIACAGPFAQVGMPVVAACVRNRTHYIDITGEFPFVRRMVAQFHDAAVERGVVLIPCCGFDSVPSDIGNYMLHSEAQAQSKMVTSVRGFFRYAGAPSGGTMASIAYLFSDITKQDLSPTSLNPPKSNSDEVSTKKCSLPSKMRLGIWYEPQLKCFSSPFLMSGTNERVVRRSNALSGRTSATYVEASAGSLLGSIGNTFLYYTLFATLAFPPLRWLLSKFAFPTPGTGPSKDQSSKFRVAVQFVATTSDGTVLRGDVRSSRDAYYLTSLFAVESAAALLDAIGDAKKVVGGVHTPSTAVGALLLQRIKAAGVHCAVEGAS